MISDIAIDHLECLKPFPEDPDDSAGDKEYGSSSDETRWLWKVDNNPFCCGTEMTNFGVNVSQWFYNFMKNHFNQFLGGDILFMINRVKKGLFYVTKLVESKDIVLYTCIQYIV